MKKLTIEQKKTEFQKDLTARLSWHKIMNFHYRSYKSISLLNEKYSKEVLESLGLQIYIPRTFMTIESIRPDLDRPIDIAVKYTNRSEKYQAERSQHILKGEWSRSKSDNQKAKAEFDALLYGTGKLLSYFELDEETTDVFEKYDNEGRPVYKKGKQKKYEGMKVKWLNPYYCIPDRKAKTYESGSHESRRRECTIAIWDFDEWKEECKKKGYKTEGMQKGGQIEELDRVKKTIDAIYTKTMSNYKTRDTGGQVISESPQTASDVEDKENSIGVITEYTAHEVNIYAGENWTECHKGINQFPKKEIPIYALKDYDVPGELEGVGEAEILRWQQYEENKIHNLMYLQVVLSTVKRFAVIEPFLEDPTQLKSSRMTEPIRLKFLAGMKADDAITTIDQSSANDVPLQVLGEVKNIGQMVTGQSDYSIGSDEGSADTLGEAEMMNVAGGKRIKQKIQQMEERGITPILESWLSAIPQLYTEEMDYLLNDGTNKDVKFLPFSRDMNKNGKLVAEYATKEGQMKAKTIEEVFLMAGYTDVVFVSDLIGSYDISVKTSLAFLDKQNMIRQYQNAITVAVNENVNKMNAGLPPVWDTQKLTAELLRQFDDIIEDVDEYKLEQQPAQPMGQPVVDGQPTAPQVPLAPTKDQIPLPVQTPIE